MKHPVEVRLIEALVPPPDFELECFVGTTYSLSPAVFLALLSAASFDWSTRGGSVGFDSLTKEEWRAVLLERRQRCLLFVDHHGPLEVGAGGLRPLETLSLDQVIKCRGRDTHSGGSLHSKLALALYRNLSGEVLGRMFVGSKNFTTSHMQEYGAVFDLRSNATSDSVRRFSRPLLTYLEYLRDTEGASTKDARLVPLHNAIALIKSRRLSAIDSSSRFYWQGRTSQVGHGIPLAEQLRDLTKEPWDAVYIHSPWTRKAAVKHLADHLPDVPFRIRCLKEPGLSTFSRTNIKYELSSCPSGVLQPYHSHAKIYFFSRGNRSVLAYGSANLTPDGWGLDVPGGHTNAELLVTTKVSARDYRYLTTIGGQTEDLSAQQHVPTLQEDILSLLNSVQIQVEFLRSTSALRYTIEAPQDSKLNLGRVVVSHELIEPLENIVGNAIVVTDGWPLPPVKDVSWSKSDLFRVSSLIRLSCPTHAVETHLIVDLDNAFYEGRARLRVLQYNAKELLASLAQVMNVALPPETPPPSGDGSHHDDQLAALLDGMRAERYAYRMARLKPREPLSFRRTMERVDKLLSAVDQAKDLAGHTRLKALVSSIRDIHAELNRT